MFWEDDPNRHNFDRIGTSYLLTEIFVFLNLSNAKVLLNVSKKFRNHLLKNDNYNLRIVGNHTYGLSI